MIFGEKRIPPKFDIHRVSEETQHSINSIQELRDLIYGIYAYAITHDGPFGPVRNCGCDPDYLNWIQQQYAPSVADHLSMCCIPGLTTDIARYRTIFVPGNLPYTPDKLFQMASLIIHNYNSADYAAAFAIQQVNEGFVIHIVVITSMIGNFTGILNESDYLERAIYGWLNYRKKQTVQMRKPMAVEEKLDILNS